MGPATSHNSVSSIMLGHMVHRILDNDAYSNANDDRRMGSIALSFVCVTNYDANTDFFLG